MFLVVMAAQSSTLAQFKLDSSAKGKLTIEGYADIYYSYAISHPVGGTRPYVVSYNRDNEVNLDLAYIRLNYTSERIRGLLSAGYGTYMNANYAAEDPVSTRPLEFWVAAGIQTERSAGYQLEHLLWKREQPAISRLSPPDVFGPLRDLQSFKPVVF